MHYSSGANLGGWLVQEAWLLPNILLTRLGGGSIKDNQEYDYIQRMCERGIDAVQSMRRHWASFLGEDDDYDLLKATSPPPLLMRLRAHGVTVLRIPVGYWMFEPPATRGCPSASPPVPEPALNRSRHGSILRSLSEEGVTADGFVTGNAPHLAALLSLLKPLGLRAVIDMHSLPGGAVRRMGYTGKFFEEAHAFDGADAWFAAVDSSGVAGPPPAAFPFLCRSVAVLERLAGLVSELDGAPATEGVVAAISPWNEALFSEDAKAAALLPPFALALLPRLRRLLPADRFDVQLNFFNAGLDWPAWLAANAAGLGGGVVADLHLYHAFDPPGGTRCGMCVAGEAGMRSVLCQSCGPDAAVLKRHADAGVRFVVGEWSLGTCGMWGAHPHTLSDPDFLYTWHASATSTFVTHGAEADFFWSATVRAGGYDPTLYTPQGLGSRAAVLAELAEAAQRPEWRAANEFVASPGSAIGVDYLVNWNLDRLSSTTTSAGHPAVLPAGRTAGGAGQAGAPVVGEGLRVLGSCDFEPAPPATMTLVAGRGDGSCGICGDLPQALAFWATSYPAVSMFALALLCVAAGCCLRRRRRRLGAPPRGMYLGPGMYVPAATARGAGGTALETPLLEGEPAPTVAPEPVPLQNAPPEEGEGSGVLPSESGQATAGGGAGTA